MVIVKQIRNQLFASANYLISEESADYCWLVDVGEIGQIIDTAEGKQVKGVFLTHCHHDHIFGINDLLESFPGCMVYLSKDGVDILASDKMNFSRYVGPTVSYQGDNTVLLEPGMSIELFPGISISILFTPGHSPDSITYKLDNYLFTGDSYIPGVPVVTKLPGGNRGRAKQSTEMILSCIGPKTIVCPGHWGKSSLPF